jgi:uncharacterized Zn finger protein (UPF0148 family)
MTLKQKALAKDKYEQNLIIRNQQGREYLKYCTKCHGQMFNRWKTATTCHDCANTNKKCGVCGIKIISHTGHKFCSICSEQRSKESILKSANLVKSKRKQIRELYKNMPMPVNKFTVVNTVNTFVKISSLSENNKQKKELVLNYHAKNKNKAGITKEMLQVINKY